MLNCPLYKRFDLIFGTSTGSIIGALLALGHEVEEIHSLYKAHLPTVMKACSRSDKSEALHVLAKDIFGDQKFNAFKTGVGIVTTKWVIEKPMIFKASLAQAHGRVGTFTPGFGCTIAAAVEASCSAYPFFDRKIVRTEAGDEVELIDGGYCANNPTLYAIADAVGPIGKPRDNLRVISVGVGAYPEAKPSWAMWALKKTVPVQLLQKTFEINTQSMDQLRIILFKDVPTVRISDTFEQPEMATDLFEHDLGKLNILRQRGAESFAPREAQLREFLL
jgi:patatin-like phospholipase/acyl hydrolase